MTHTTAKATVDEFIAQKKLAVVGVSCSGKKFGNHAYRELKARGHRLFPIHPQAGRVEGDRCYPNLAALPEPVDAVWIRVSPAQAEPVVREAAAAGIPRVWLQQGAESEAAARFGQERGLSVVQGECILMFASDKLLHRLHRWVWGWLGKLPR